MTDKVSIVKETLEKIGVENPKKNLIIAAAAMDVNPDSLTRMTMAAADNIVTKEANSTSPKKYYMKNATKTERKIHQMLTESTGAAAMDSGGDDGRKWQQNRKIRDMRLNERVTYSTYEEADYIEATTDVFHWLVENVDYNSRAEELTADFMRFAKKSESGYYCNISEWLDHKKDYEQFDDIIETSNSSEYDSTLSQVLQWANFTEDGTNYIILQTHNGADIRGGYSTPVVFKVCDMFYPVPQIRLSCDCKSHEGTSDLHKEWKSEKIGNTRYDYTKRCQDCEELVKIE